MQGDIFLLKIFHKTEYCLLCSDNCGRFIVENMIIMVKAKLWETLSCCTLIDRLNMCTSFLNRLLVLLNDTISRAKKQPRAGVEQLLTKGSF